jgi:diphthine-ammonia ligase
VHRVIKGKPIRLDLEYTDEGIDKNDEVEDLYELLKEIKEKHPEVNAVSSGAIHSTYQKNRVENVYEAPA